MNVEAIRAKTKSMITQIELMSDILTKAKTIQKRGEHIAKSVKDIKIDLEAGTASILELLNSQKIRKKDKA